MKINSIKNTSIAYLYKSHLVKILSKILLIFFIICRFASAQTPITTDSRIRTLVYNPNEVYELKFYYNYQSFIEFAEDEEIETISIGESFAWKLTPSGKRLFIRPLAIAAHTNVTIISNKRSYHFDIRSDEYTGRADEDLVYTVRFFYPQIGQSLPMPPQLALPNVAMKIPAPSPVPVVPVVPVVPTNVPTNENPRIRIDEPLPGVIERNPENNELNFDYSFAGSAENIMPTKVFDNGIETSFQFANDNLVIPTISSVDVYGKETQVTYVLRDKYVVVPMVSKQFTLRTGNDLLCIYNIKSLK
jgi:type IV secretion system protein VirB9